MNGSKLEENFEENIGLLIHDVARLLRVLYDRQMASIGLTRSQWWLLTQPFNSIRSNDLLKGAFSISKSIASSD